MRSLLSLTFKTFLFGELSVTHFNHYDINISILFIFISSIIWWLHCSCYLACILRKTRLHVASKSVFPIYFPNWSVIAIGYNSIFACKFFHRPSSISADKDISFSYFVRHDVQQIFIKFLRILLHFNCSLVLRAKLSFVFRDVRAFLFFLETPAYISLVLRDVFLYFRDASTFFYLISKDTSSFPSFVSRDSSVFLSCFQRCQCLSFFCFQRF